MKALLGVIIVLAMIPLLGFGQAVDQLHAGEEPNVPHYLPFKVTADCVAGTVNRFSGSYHGNLYIGNSSGTNVLLAWGQGMNGYITGSGTANLTSPTVVSSANYSGILYEVRSSSSGGANGYSAFALRTSTNLYFWGTAANLTAITSMSGFGGAGLVTAASNVTSKLPVGVSVSDIASMAISQTAFAIVTNAGEVYVLTKVANLQGDKAAAGPAIWHHVMLTDGTTPLSNVTKLSLSSSGAFALTSLGNLYYWGSPANVAGVANTSTSYNYAYDMTSTTPSGVTVTDVVCLGTKTPSASTLFILGSDQKVYGCGLNTNGVLGVNNATTTYNQPTFVTVKGTDGVSDLSNIVRIDGDTEADIFTMGAMSSTGKIYGWGDSPAGMLGVPATGASTSSYAVPKTRQMYDTTMSFSDFSVAGHFTIAFYTSGGTDQYWYLGHNTGGSIGDPANSTAYIVDPNAAYLNATGGVSFNCSNTQPTISVVSSVVPFVACAGSASPTQSFTVSGSSLSANITVTAPTGFEVSTSPGSGFASSATLTRTGSSVPATTVYVQLALGAAGTPGTIVCSSASAADQTVSVSGSVAPLPTVASVTPGSRSGSGTVALAGTASAGATLDWYAAPSGGSPLAGGTGVLSFTTPSISVTTTYFAEARNTTTGCTSSARTAVDATVIGSFSGGTIGSDQSTCSGTTSSSFTSASAASGGTGSISYQWQSSTTSPVAGFADIVGATLSTLPAQGPLSQTTYYRRMASTNVPADGSVASNVVTVTIFAIPTVTSTTPNSRNGVGSVILSGTASAGATLDWYATPTGGSVQAGGHGVLTFTTPVLGSTTTFYVEARNTSTGCVSSSRTAVTATLTGSLPIQLLSFGASLTDGSIALNWETLSETNNYGFEVEKSPLGFSRTWTCVGFIPGAGTTLVRKQYAFIDHAEAANGYYRLRQIDFDGSSNYSNEIRIDLSVTGIVAEEPMEFQLKQNYPNPFNPSTVISFSLTASAHTTLIVYDVLGRQVATLIDTDLERGWHDFRWDARVAGGTYICRLMSGDKTSTIKVLLLK